MRGDQSAMSEQEVTRMRDLQAGSLWNNTLFETIVPIRVGSDKWATPQC